MSKVKVGLVGSGFVADLLTAILANHASTSDDDVFGDLGGP